MECLLAVGSCGEHRSPWEARITGNEQAGYVSQLYVTVKTVMCSLALRKGYTHRPSHPCLNETTFRSCKSVEKRVVGWSFTFLKIKTDKKAEGLISYQSQSDRSQEALAMWDRIWFKLNLSYICCHHEIEFLNYMPQRARCSPVIFCSLQSFIIEFCGICKLRKISFGHSLSCRLVVGKRIFQLLWKGMCSQSCDEHTHLLIILSLPKTALILLFLCKGA